MINYPLSEAEIFDRFAILMQKSRIGLAVQEEMRLIMSVLTKDLGQEIVEEILASEEYRNLYNINKLIFNLVDLSRKNDTTAKEVADANDKRFLYKKALQEKFFGKTSEFLERKNI
jgi:hypothetical protein